MKHVISTYFKSVATILAAALLLFACNKDKDNDNYTFVFDTPAAYFNLGQTQTLGFTRSGNVARLTISAVPEGWNAVMNQSAGTVTLTAPDSLDEYENEDGETVTPAEYGTLTLRGYVGDKTATAFVFVSLRKVVDLSKQFANSFVLTEPLTGYIISAVRPDGSAVEGISTVETVWKTGTNLVGFISYSNGKISLRTTSDDDDELMEGNALLAAKDADGNILWCWHMWVTKTDPAAEAVHLNGNTFMACNLGAFGNSTEDDDAILASYGLYYQWGRPTPFPRPRYYNCAGAASESWYWDDISSPSMKVEECGTDNSTIAAATANPMVFVTGLERPWSGSPSWNDTTKSNYDPCPAGWRVPSSNVFEGLSIVQSELEGEMSALERAYGWRLTDGGDEAFFFAGGRRSYLDGSVINMNTAETPKPWQGFYWTTSLASSQQAAVGMFFDLNTENAAFSTLNAARELQLSNGLQIRCVREQ